jgi:capsular exopolysaccharide synthesis family protein
MNNLEKYLDQVIEQKPVVYDSPVQPEPSMPPSVMDALRRRWYIVVLVSALISALALPALWLLIKPRYVVTGYIRVAPLLPRILTGEQDRGEISDYDSYMNTQAATILSPDVRDAVAKELQPQNLSFLREDANDPIVRITGLFRIGPRTRDPVEVLRKAITKGIIAAAPLRRTELISVTVKSRNDAEAKLIINSFLRVYQYRYKGSSDSTKITTLDELNRKQDELSKKIIGQQGVISQVALPFGTTALDSRQQMEMQQQATLWAEKTRQEARRMSLEASIAALKQLGDSNTPPEQLMAARKEYINADSMVKELTRNIVELKRDMLIARQRLAPENPEIVRQQQLLTVFEESLNAKEKELTQEFEAQVAARAAMMNAQRIAAFNAELNQVNQYYQSLTKELDSQKTMTTAVGKANVNLQDMQLSMTMDQQLLEQIRRRISDINMETPRAARIGRMGEPEITSIEDKRAKYSAVVVFLALGCGFGLAMLRDRTDKTLQSPDDLTRQLDLPVIGTTTSSRTIKPALFAEHLASDYQTIRTNLSLLTAGGMPKKLAVSSAGMREGKTTFAVNLATSLAKSGKKVLLIDGDLRKPDIGHMLGILNGSAGLQDVLLGGNPNDAIHVVASSGLHVLVANPRNLADAYELLTSTMAAEQIEKLSRQYDHLIVDTPPALAFPDALVWAKLTDAVVLISFAGQTTAPDLKEARERFGRIRAHVLGTVLSNVPVYHSLYRSNYGYRPTEAQAKYKARKVKRMLLLTHGEETDAGTKPDADAGDRET